MWPGLDSRLMHLSFVCCLNQRFSRMFTSVLDIQMFWFQLPTYSNCKMRSFQEWNEKWYNKHVSRWNRKGRIKSSSKPHEKLESTQNSYIWCGKKLEPESEKCALKFKFSDVCSRRKNFLGYQLFAFLIFVCFPKIENQCFQRIGENRREIVNLLKSCTFSNCTFLVRFVRQKEGCQNGRNPEIGHRRFFKV